MRELWKSKARRHDATVAGHVVIQTGHDIHSLAIVVVIAADADLSTNLAGRELGGMDVDVGHARVDGLEDFGKFTGSDALSVGADDVGGGDGAGDGAAASWASAGRVGWIGIVAEENHDA